MNFSYKNIDSAYAKIKNHIIRTPLISSDYINTQLNSKIFFKLENLQTTGSFKYRGASYKISKLSDENKKNGVVAYSSGNHAQAVAYASLQQNISCKIIIYLGKIQTYEFYVLFLIVCTVVVLSGIISFLH